MWGKKDAAKLTVEDAGDATTVEEKPDCYCTSEYSNQTAKGSLDDRSSKVILIYAKLFINPSKPLSHNSPDQPFLELPNQWDPTSGAGAGEVESVTLYNIGRENEFAEIRW